MSPYPPKFSTQSIDYKSMARTYTKHWFWFIFCGILAISLAFLYLRYQIPQYSAQAQIKLIDKESDSQLSVFKDLGVISDDNSSMRAEDEILTVKSRYNLMQVVKRLKLNVRYFLVGNVVDSELYKVTPINLTFSASDSLIYKSNYVFYLDLVSNTTLRFTENIDEPGKAFKYGDSIDTYLGNMTVTLNKDYHEKSLKDLRLKVVINPVSTVAQRYSGKISISPEQRGSNILNVYLADPVQEKAQDVINELLTVYNENTILDKKAIADRTSNFINNRISSLYSELSTVDQTAAEFKSTRGLTNIDSQSDMNLSASVEEQQELQNTQVQMNMISALEDEIDTYNGYNDYIPYGVGVDDPNLGNYITKYNDLVSQRKKLLESSGTNNPAVVQLDQQLSDLKVNLKSSISSINKNLNLKANTLSENLNRYKSSLYMAPKNAKALRDITRKQETKEALYLYLLQKREESQIAYASTESNIKIIDPAYSLSKAPIGPDKKVVYLGAFLLGMIIPFFLIYTRNLLDTKIHTRKDLEKLIDVNPILGEIPAVSKKQTKTIVKNDHSVLAEALRILRANLDYMLKSTMDAKKPNNIVYITSSVSGEGKSFVSLNLSSILSKSNLKVLLIEADIRNPKLITNFPGFKKNEIKGLTDYLYDETVTVEDVVTSVSKDHKFDLIFSGKIPPNPTDLLMNKRLELLLTRAANEYDYVIVDTSPLVPVADTLLISKFASVLLYVVKSNETESKIIEHPIKLKEQGKLNRLAFVMNNVKSSDLGYGGKYGYGYGNKKKWWQKK
ncbi:MAG: polysaccharide biosynthesis tyrosine autokinase [Mangrovimonas sp.]|nr:polysaccharide biosynthesis tyrosine autokinase [Mangrovimonas sp.]